MYENIEDAVLLKEYLNKSDITVNYMLSLVNDILDIEKLEQGKTDIVKEPTDIRKLIDSVIVMINGSIEAKDLDLDVQADIQHSYILCDSVKLKQVLMNILGNAVKFTPERGKISFDVLEKISDDKSLALIFKVSDTGCGMTDEFKEHIFEAFSQEKNRISDITKGTGLGMAISYRIMKAMGGSLEVSSSLGKGSCFTAVMPFEEADRAELDKKSEILYYNKPNLKSPFKLLLAEDNEMNAGVLSDILEQEGFSVVIAENGMEAFDVIKESRDFEFDAVLMDVLMPVMDGFTLLKKIKTNLEFSHIPIILLTAKNTLQSRMEGLELGADAYIDKPFSMDLLLTQVTNLLNNRSNMRAYYFNSPIANIKSMAYTKADEKFLKKLNDIIDSHINDVNLDVDMIADLMNLSRPTLYRKINGLSNVTPNELIKISRLKKAAELILQGDMRIYEIAEAVGFNSQSYFSRAFSKQFNMSPSQYAKENNIELK